MKYAFLVYITTTTEEKRLLASVPASKEDYDGVGYLQPGARIRVLERVLAYVSQRRNLELVSIEMLHPATEQFLIRSDCWNLETFSCPAPAMTTQYSAENGHTLYRSSYKMLPSLAIAL